MLDEKTLYLCVQKNTHLNFLTLRLFFFYFLFIFNKANSLMKLQGKKSSSVKQHNKIIQSTVRRKGMKAEEAN